MTDVEAFAFASKEEAVRCASTNAPPEEFREDQKFSLGVRALAWIAKNNRWPRSRYSPMAHMATGEEPELGNYLVRALTDQSDPHFKALNDAVNATQTPLIKTINWIKDHHRRPAVRYSALRSAGESEHYSLKDEHNAAIFVNLFERRLAKGDVSFEEEPRYEELQGALRAVAFMEDDVVFSVRWLSRNGRLPREPDYSAIMNANVSAYMDLDAEARVYRTIARLSASRRQRKTRLHGYSRQGIDTLFALVHSIEGAEMNFPAVPRTAVAENVHVPFEEDDYSSCPVEDKARLYSLQTRWYGHVFVAYPDAEHLKHAAFTVVAIHSPVGNDVLLECKFITPEFKVAHGADESVAANGDRNSFMTEQRPFIDGTSGLPHLNRGGRCYYLWLMPTEEVALAAADESGIDVRGVYAPLSFGCSKDADDGTKVDCGTLVLPAVFDEYQLDQLKQTNFESIEPALHVAMAELHQVWVETNPMVKKTQTTSSTGYCGLYDFRFMAIPTPMPFWMDDDDVEDDDDLPILALTSGEIIRLSSHSPA